MLAALSEGFVQVRLYRRVEAVWHVFGNLSEGYPPHRGQFVLSGDVGGAGQDVAGDVRHVPFGQRVDAYAEQPAGGDGQAGLLQRLADGGPFRQFAGFDFPSGERPEDRAWFAALDQEDAVVLDDDSGSYGRLHSG